MMASKLERTFYTRLKQLAPHLPEPVAEYKFHETRRWRFDYCWPDYSVAVELEGGVWSRGRHTRGKGFIEDCHKYNAAAVDGWTVLRFTSDMLRDDPVACIETIILAIGAVTE